MISNVYQSENFGRLVNYLTSKQGASRIGGNMVLYEAEGLIREFRFIHSLKPRAPKPVIHVCFSLPDGDALDSDQWETIADRYMKEMKLDYNQYITVRHTDAAHDHIHILASRIRLDGKLSSLWQSKAKSQQFVRQIEKEFDLQRIPSSWEAPKRREKLHSPERKDYICSALDSALSVSSSLEDLRKHLRPYQVSMRETKKTDVTLGLSYGYSGIYITGKSLDRPYSLVEDKLSENREASHNFNPSSQAKTVKVQNLSTNLSTELETALTNIKVQKKRTPSR